MSTAVDAVTEIIDTNKAALNDLLERQDVLSDTDMAAEFAGLQGEGIWSAILELARRIDETPEVATRAVNDQLRSL